MKKEKLAALAKVLLFVGITMIFGYFFTQNKRGGIMDDALLNHNDPHYVMDQKVKNLKTEGLNVGEAINFIVPLEKIDYDNLVKIKTFTDKLKEEFPDYGILSLSTAANYHDTGNELLTTPHINEEQLKQFSNSNINPWKRDVRHDHGTYGLLISRNFTYATVYMMLPASYDEIQTFRKIAELLEKRKISRLEWFWKKNIKPVGEYANIKVGGWVMARGLMDAALNADILILSCVGLLLTWLTFVFNFLSWRQASIASITVLLGLIWSSGTVGLAQALGLPLYERVYFLLVLTAVIVAGISFVARKLEKYNEIKKTSPHLTETDVWRLTKCVNGPILLTAIIAIANFATLYQIQIRGILEVGIFASFGITYLLLLSLIFLPALQLLLGDGKESGASISSDNPWQRFLNRIILFCYDFCDQDNSEQLNTSKPAKKALAIISSALILAIVLVGLDYLKINTRPIEYIKGTIVDQASELLNKKGNSGFDRISFLIKPRNKPASEESITDPVFVNDVARFKKKLLKLPIIREVNSPMDTVEVISRQLYKHRLPESKQEAHEAFMQMESSLDPLIKEQLWYKHGIVMYASSTADDSNELGILSNQILKLAQDDFSDLEVMTFGKLNLYPRADEYIRLGKPLNVLTSQWIVFIIYAFWLGWWNWKNKRVIQTSCLSPWRGGLVMNVPFIFATSVITIVMVIFQVPLDQATACMSALAINAAADFGLYLVNDYREKLNNGGNARACLQYSLLTHGHVVVADVALNAICFAPLMLSNFIPVVRLGWIMVVMLIACGFGALVLMPSLLPWATRKK